MPVTAERARDLAWPTCFNARDLGGHATHDGRRTRWGAVVRADNVGHLNEDGCAALIAYGIGTIVDLRSQSEHTYEPVHPFRENTAPDDTPRYVHIPLIDETDRETDAVLRASPSREASYRLMLDRCRGQIAMAVRAVANAPPGGVLFHCHSGTDRAGLVAALLLNVAGVPLHTIVADYTHSHERLEAFYEHYRAQIADPEAQARFERLTAPPELIISTVAYLEPEFGGAEAYLRSAGVADADLARLRKRFLD